MQVFLSHTSVDKDVVKAIGGYLKEHGMSVWLDEWQMSAGDSLINKIGEGIEASDRLVVCLTPMSVESNWVRKEVATGLVMELAEEKGFGEKFVIPALLVPCKVPIMLRDKLYANFTNKAFEAACTELQAGLIDTPRGPTDVRFENSFIRTHPATSSKVGKYAAIVELGVHISPTEGLSIIVDTGAAYTDVIEWFAPPNKPQIPSIAGSQYTSSTISQDPPFYVHKCSSPGVTSTRSFYLFFEAGSPINIAAVQFRDFFDQLP